MRLAFVSTLAATPWGGSEELWTTTAAKALAAGHEVLLMTYRWPSRHPKIEALERQGARLHERASESFFRRSWITNKIRNPFRALGDFAPRAVLISQAGTYDIAHAGEATALRSTLADQKLPYILLSHCEQAKPASVRRIRRARSAFESAAITGFLGQRLRRMTEAHLGIALPSARVFQNPLRLGDSGPLPWPTGGCLQMAFVGRLERIKGLDLLIEILAAPEWRARDWNLTLCGAGREFENLNRQVERAGLRERVHFAGFVDDVTDIWRDHHVLVMPSRAEGVPLALHEAMHCARPAVTTDVGGITEWVTQGETGFVAPTVKEFALQLAQMWESRPRLEEMGRRAHAQLSGRQDVDPARTMLGWMEEVAARSARPGTTRVANLRRSADVSIADT
jgi:glycosyltransferase involved in cell wall biosynthesis